METQDRHPEDLIYDVKGFIKELAIVQDLYFDSLVKTLKLDSVGEDFLFDYVYNHTGDECFDEYLDLYGRTYNDFIKGAKR